MNLLTVGLPATELHIGKLSISDHFICRCGDRAPWLVQLKKGGGLKPNWRKLDATLAHVAELPRWRTIGRILRHGDDRARYFVTLSSKSKRQLVIVKSGGTLVTIYRLSDSRWAEQAVSWMAGYAKRRRRRGVAGCADG